MNVPSLIARVIETRKATLHELETVYSVGDCYLMLEMASVSAHNRRKIDEYLRAKGDG